MARPKPPRTNNTTRLIDASRDMSKARERGDSKAFKRAFSVYDRVRENGSFDDYNNFFVPDPDRE